MADEQPNKEGLRLRVGVLFIFLWWLPIWLLSPAISDLLGYSNDPSAQHTVFIVLILIQTALGILGLLLASRGVIPLFKSMPRKQVPGTVWRILRTGKQA